MTNESGLITVFLTLLNFARARWRDILPICGYPRRMKRHSIWQLAGFTGTPA